MTIFYYYQSSYGELFLVQRSLSGDTQELIEWEEAGLTDLPCKIVPGKAIKLWSRV